MTASRKLLPLFTAGLVGFLALWITVASLAAVAVPQSYLGEQGVQAVERRQDEEASEPLGEPCGSGELLPLWVVCLHGTVTWFTSTNEFELLGGVEIAISRGITVVTGTTFVHPGHTTPTYGVDISPLYPQFLEPVTLTTRVRGEDIQRQIIVFPNFDNHNQRYDIEAGAVGGLEDAAVAGLVVHYASEGPVEGATVTAEFQGETITTTTQGDPPTYGFTHAVLADTLHAGVGDRVTITAKFDGDVDQKIVRVPAGSGSVQENFIVGWRCDDFNPIPQEGGRGGLPQEGGRGGLPDVACFWGYGLVDGLPQAGMQIQLTIHPTEPDGEVVQTVTQFYPGEALPRYAIAVHGASEIGSGTVEVVGVFAGQTETVTVPISLDEAQHQQIDVPISGAEVLDQLTRERVNDLTQQGDHLWVATTRDGVISWTVSTHTYEQWTVADGLASDSVNGSAIDVNGDLWFATASGASHYDRDSKTFTNFPGSFGPVAADQVRSVWFGTFGAGVWQYDLAAEQWFVYTTESTAGGLIHNTVRAIAIANNGQIWFSTIGGVSRYDPGANQWVSFDLGALNAQDMGSAIAVGANGDVWVATGSPGARHYLPATNSWEPVPALPALNVGDIAAERANEVWFGFSSAAQVCRYHIDTGTCQNYTPADGLPSASVPVNAATIGQDGTVWVGSLGVSRLDINNNSSQTFIALAENLVNEHVTAVAADHQGGIWFGSFGGASLYYPDTNQWFSYTVEADLQSGFVDDIVVGSDDRVWLATLNGVRRFVPQTDSWRTYTLTHGLPSMRVQAAAEGPDGTIWVGTLDGGAARYLPGTDNWEAITEEDGLLDNRVYGIAVGEDGAVWFATHEGVSRYRATDANPWRHYTAADGLIDGAVGNIAFGSAGELWVAIDERTTSSPIFRGISRYLPESDNWRSFTNTGGLNRRDANALAVTENGDPLLGHNGGLALFNSETGEWRPVFTEAATEDILLEEDGSLWLGTSNGVYRLQVPVPQSDLLLRFSGPAAALPQKTASYTMTVENLGERAAEEVSLTLTLPPVFGTAPLVWELGTLPAGSTAISRTAEVPVSGAAIPGSQVIATATVATTSPESFVSNNEATLTTRILDPDKADMALTLVGPPLLPPGETVAFTLIVRNDGALAAENVVVTATLPAELSPIGPVSWNLGTVAATTPQNPPQELKLVVTVDGGVPGNTQLSVAAGVTTTTADGNPQNNHAAATVYTSLEDARTLILVAPDRLAGASEVLSKLYELAGQPQVQGVVLNVLGEPAVAAAYAAWDDGPGDANKANDVARAIKVLIDDYTIRYPNLQYLVLVGSDDVIPFYRIADLNLTQWQERNYATTLPPGSTVRAAFAANQFLTDDFYADRSPAMVNSPRWTGNHPIYLPDFAIGRLVETADEMVTAIDAFLKNRGVIDLTPAVVGGDPRLTFDLRNAQCALLGSAAICAANDAEFEAAVRSASIGTILAAQHSNHFTLGPLSADDIQEREHPFDQSLLLTIGCHAGLNIPRPQLASNLSDFDLVQAFLGRGGTVIATTGYGYASTISVGYSEALAEDLTRRLLTGGTQSVGLAVAQAKLHYYTSRDGATPGTGWLDHIDEKALLGLTIYGLPMLQVRAPAATAAAAASQPAPPLFSEASLDQPNLPVNSLVTSRRLRVVGLNFTRNTTDEGDYFTVMHPRYAAGLVAQKDSPTQPTLQVPLNPVVGRARTIRGVILRGATYTEFSPFDPLIAEAWALSAPEMVNQPEPPVMGTGWDRLLPFALGYSPGLPETVADDVANLNLVPGAFHWETGTERLFNRLDLELLYSRSADHKPPTIRRSLLRPENGDTVITVRASDKSGVSRVIAVCDDGAGRWTSIRLQQRNRIIWSGTCAGIVERAFAQVLDRGGNVTIREVRWQR